MFHLTTYFVQRSPAETTHGHEAITGPRLLTTIRERVPNGFIRVNWHFT